MIGLQKVAVAKFINKQVGNKENKEVDRIRAWLFAKLNKKFVKPQQEMQFGCPDITPGLRAQPWW